MNRWTKSDFDKVHNFWKLRGNIENSNESFVKDFENDEFALENAMTHSTKSEHSSFTSESNHSDLTSEKK